ncbi:carboxypeptidase-like regulatory domain-containing protein [Adhaeribacter sp. BT258]|uniref:Carboxypeptidase-like regulatory domain-containing protein n=1 Tax=Adhaeribacter terrigena TaxID=2793070 RepID=A0ABS1C0A3_9BACT|nr:carboxypeptidase-like regulatory domain-containing protein [Adhaeribacter terrigena]
MNLTFTQTGINLKLKLLLLLLFTVTGITSLAQEKVFNGRVIDAQTGEPLPFVSVYFKNSDFGTTTNFDGNYSFKAIPPTDSLTVSYVGYITRSKAITKEKVQTINFQLQDNSTSLAEVLIRPTENPAFKILRQVVAHKALNNKEKLSAYQYESYNKIELDVDNITDAFKKRSLIKPVTSILDSIKLIAGDEGEPVLPVFISESLSDFYYLKNPKKTKEIIKASKVTGIGMDDGSLISQLIGSTFQEYNFYDNRMNLLNKEFVSPIADGWKLYYDYDLEDSLYINGVYCYKLKVIPRRAQDLVFGGYMWIAKENYALRQVDLSVGKSANLNFIEKVKIQQELQPTASGPYLPVKTRLLVKIISVGKQRPGMLAKIYTSSRNIQVNQPQALQFYAEPVELAEKALKHNDAFWNENRHDSLSATEQHVYAMIDSVREIPAVKTYVEIVNIIINGYKTVGKIDLGPYPYTYAYNNIEGHRFQLGFKTNPDFSRKIEFSGFGAYGTRDGRFKYRASGRAILSRRKWTEVGISDKEDLQQIGLESDKIGDNALFLASSRFGELKRPYRQHETELWAQRELFKGFTERITLRQRSFNPLFPFSYVFDSNENGVVLKNSFSTSEIIFDTRFANNELFLQSENSRISLGNKGWPVFNLRYLLGLKNALGSDVSYQRLEANVKQDIPMGILGTGRYELEAGRIFSTVPYPLLEVHLGNETPFYTRNAFALMNYFEFASDSYASLHYNQHLEGFGLNSIPLISKLKWRMVLTGNVLYGHLSDANLALLPAQDHKGRDLETFSQFTNGLPYAEVGYGFENIFKFLRVQAFHRLTYRNNPDANNFGIKLAAQFNL